MFTPSNDGPFVERSPEAEPPSSPIADGIHSTVSRARRTHLDPRPSTVTSPLGEWVAIKTVSSYNQEHCRPHNIRKEAIILANISHPNIVQLLGADYLPHSLSYQLKMPLLPLCLSELLDCSGFSPHPMPNFHDISLSSSPTSLFGLIGLNTQQSVFEVLTKSISFQILLALAHIHSLDPPLSHRDIKPTNIMLTETGCVQLIDFGIAWQHNPSFVQDQDQFERPGDLCFQIGSGSFRAPELLFSARDYDPVAIDLWGLGATLAHFYRPLYLDFTDPYLEHSDSDSDPSTASANELSAFITCGQASLDLEPVKSSRLPLFDSGRGELGLVWSIFKTRGTPNVETWPAFKDLPDARSVEFQVVPPVSLYELLPNLPSRLSSIPPDSPVDLIDRLLAYPPHLRLKAETALKHSWFTNGLPLMLPRNHPGPVYRTGQANHSLNWVTQWNGQDLSQWLHREVGRQIEKLTRDVTHANTW